MISASAARLTTSSGGVRSWIWQSPKALSSSQLKSPGFNVWPSRTTIFISLRPRHSPRRSEVAEFDYEDEDDDEGDWLIFCHRFAAAQAECVGDLAGLGQHHAGFAGDGDELKTFAHPSLRGGSVKDVDARRDAVFLRCLQDVCHGVGELFVVALKHRFFSH